jgi:hypothetical protein
MNGSYLTDSTVGNTQLAAGVVVQMVGTAYSAVATGTTVIPQDDTNPQITEGTEFMTQTITPKSATNLLIIDVSIYLCHSANAAKLAAMFQDANVNALAARYIYQGNWTDPTEIVLRHVMTAGTTSATTFRVRGGGSAAGTVTFNGTLGSRTMGTANKSSIVITEAKV